MKIIAILLFLISTNLFAQDKIVLAGNDTIDCLITEKNYAHINFIVNETPKKVSREMVRVIYIGKEDQWLNPHEGYTVQKTLDLLPLMTMEPYDFIDESGKWLEKSANQQGLSLGLVALTAIGVSIASGDLQTVIAVGGSVGSLILQITSIASKKKAGRRLRDYSSLMKRARG